jgi:hypothetical protein
MQRSGVSVLIPSSLVLTSRPRRGGSLSSATLSGSDVADSSLAAAAILLGIERYRLAFDQVAHVE